MKKILIAFLFLIVAFAVQSQNATVDKTLNYDETYYWFDGATSDTIGATDSTWMLTVRKKNDTRILPYIAAKMDSLGGTGDTVNVYLQNKVFPDQNYSNLDTVIWPGQGPDSGDTIYFDYGTAVKGEYWRLLFVGENDSFKAGIDWVNFKFSK
jgi:hypothetical protein